MEDTMNIKIATDYCKTHLCEDCVNSLFSKEILDNYNCFDLLLSIDRIFNIKYIVEIKPYAQTIKPKVNASDYDKKTWIKNTDKWFTNLTTVGNVGSVAIFAALDELVRTKELNDGDKILLLVPESGRFSYGVVLLTVNKN